MRTKPSLRRGDEPRGGGSVRSPSSTIRWCRRAPLGTAPASLAPQRLLTDLALDAAVKDPKAIAMRMLRAVWMSSEQGLGEQALSEVEALLEDEVAAQQPWLRLYAGLSFETANHLDRSQRVPRARGEYEAALKLAGGPM